MSSQLSDTLREISPETRRGAEFSRTGREETSWRFGQESWLRWQGGALGCFGANDMRRGEGLSIQEAIKTGGCV